MEITPSIIRRTLIFLALAGAGGCWWFAVSILMPELIYAWIALAFVPIFLTIAAIVVIFECGKGNWFSGDKLLPSLLIVGGVFLLFGGAMLHIVVPAKGKLTEFDGNIFVATHMTFLPSAMPADGQLEVIALSPKPCKTLGEDCRLRDKPARQALNSDGQRTFLVMCRVDGALRLPTTLRDP